MRCGSRAAGVSVLIIAAAAAFAQESKPASKPADEPVAIVNGQPIMESQIDEMVAQGKQMTPEELAQARKRVQASMPRIVEHLIENELVFQDAKTEGVSVTAEDLEKEMNKALDDFLKTKKMSREEYAKQFEAQMNKPLNEFLKERSKLAGYKASVLQDRLLAKKYADELKVTDEDVKQFYDQNIESRYTQREDLVRASHILFGTQDAKRQPISEDAKKEQLKKAEEVLVEAKKPGADFAALAQKYSSCPSKDRGGDLDFFPKARMVAPFSEAAFSMKVGETSDIVETQFGYHIIKVTDRKPPGTMPFEEVKDQILKDRQDSKKQAITLRYRNDLKKAAKIVYPPGKEAMTRPAPPPTRPAPMTRPAFSQPATRPQMTRPTMTRPGGTIRLLPRTTTQPEAK